MASARDEYNLMPGHLTEKAVSLTFEFDGVDGHHGLFSDYVDS